MLGFGLRQPRRLLLLLQLPALLLPALAQRQLAEARLLLSRLGCSRRSRRLLHLPLLLPALPQRQLAEARLLARLRSWHCRLHLLRLLLLLLLLLPLPALPQRQLAEARLLIISLLLVPACRCCCCLRRLLWGRLSGWLQTLACMLCLELSKRHVLRLLLCRCSCVRWVLPLRLLLLLLLLLLMRRRRWMRHWPMRLLRRSPGLLLVASQVGRRPCIPGAAATKAGTIVLWSEEVHNVCQLSCRPGGALVSRGGSIGCSVARRCSLLLLRRRRRRAVCGRCCCRPAVLRRSLLWSGILVLLLPLLHRRSRVWRGRCRRCRHVWCRSIRRRCRLGVLWQRRLGVNTSRQLMAA